MRIFLHELRNQQRLFWRNRESAVFVFIFVMWINIHHYFIDNVIWRRDNEDVRKYLFAPR